MRVAVGSCRKARGTFALFADRPVLATGSVSQVLAARTPKFAYISLRIFRPSLPASLWISSSHG
jgi:hypothetical protein